MTVDSITPMLLNRFSVQPHPYPAGGFHCVACHCYLKGYTKGRCLFNNGSKPQSIKIVVSKLYSLPSNVSLLNLTTYLKVRLKLAVITLNIKMIIVSKGTHV